MTAGDAEWAKRGRSNCGYVTVLCVSESNSGCVPTRSSPQTQGGVWKLITGRKAEISIQRMNNSSSVTRSPDKEPPGGNEREEDEEDSQGDAQTLRASESTRHQIHFWSSCESAARHTDTKSTSSSLYSDQLQCSLLWKGKKELEVIQFNFRWSCLVTGAYVQCQWSPRSDANIKTLEEQLAATGSE